MLLPRAGVWLGFLVALGVCERAHAAELDWSAPQGCGDGARLRAQVEQLVGRPLDTVQGVSFEVTLAPGTGGQVQVTVRTLPVDGEPRTRELASSSCAEALDAAAVAVAMAVTSEDSAADGGDPPSGDSSAKDEAAPLPPPSTPEPAVDTAPWLRGSIGAGLLLDAGALPSLAPGAVVELGLGISLLRVLLQAAVFASQEVLLADGARGGEFSLLLGGLLACVDRDLASVGVLACAGLELGQLSATGVGLLTREDADRGWRAMQLQVGVRWPARAELALSARAGATLPLSRPEFLVDGSDRVHKPASLTGRALVGAELAF